MTYEVLHCKMLRLIAEQTELRFQIDDNLNSFDPEEDQRANVFLDRLCKVEYRISTLTKMYPEITKAIVNESK